MIYHTMCVFVEGGGIELFQVTSCYKHTQAMRARVNFWVDRQGKYHKKSDWGNFKPEGFISIGFLLLKDFLGQAKSFG